MGLGGAQTRASHSYIVDLTKKSDMNLIRTSQPQSGDNKSPGEMCPTRRPRPPSQLANGGGGGLQVKAVTVCLSSPQLQQRQSMSNPKILGQPGLPMTLLHSLSGQENARGGWSRCNRTPSCSHLGPGLGGGPWSRLGRCWSSPKPELGLATRGSLVPG